jgi:hypothetical protein
MGLAYINQSARILHAYDSLYGHSSKVSNLPLYIQRSISACAVVIVAAHRDKCLYCKNSACAQLDLLEFQNAEDTDLHNSHIVLSHILVPNTASCRRCSRSHGTKARRLAQLCQKHATLSSVLGLRSF